MTIKEEEGNLGGCSASEAKEKVYLEEANTACSVQDCGEAKPGENRRAPSKAINMRVFRNLGREISMVLRQFGWDKEVELGKQKCH